MAHVARAFDEHRGGKVVRPLPARPERDGEEALPYCKVRPHELPPMMFQVRLHDGQMISFAYSDLRKIWFRDAGHLELEVFAVDRTIITIEGRHLKELAGLFGLAMVRWVQEADRRDLARPESDPEIVRIDVQYLDA